MEKESKELEEAPEAKMHLSLFRATLKMYPIGKPQALIAYMNTGLKIHFDQRQIVSRNELMLIRNRHTRMEDLRKEHPDKKEWNKIIFLNE